MAKKTHNITLATLFGADKPTAVPGDSAVETEYTGIQLDLDTIASNAIDTFKVNGNVVNFESSTLSVILPNAAAIGADEETGNWIINGATTSIRARGIDGTVAFDSLSIDQKRELTFTSAVVTTLNPGEAAVANIVDHCDGEQGVGVMSRTLELSIPKGDRGDVLFATFDINAEGYLEMDISEDYHGAEFSIDEDGYLQFSTEGMHGHNEKGD